MEKLTNIIEAILFASGKSVSLDDIADKLGVTVGEVRRSLAELKQKYNEESGIQLLEFNKKAQLASNPVYKDGVAAVLNPIREKELTRTILECAAIIAYKQPITRTEIELLRGLNSDYAVNALLELNLIYRCGRKDAVGHPVLFATTDEFLKRFKLRSLEDLPDYETLMAAITRSDEDKDNYLYARDEYKDPSENPSQEKQSARPPKKAPEKGEAQGEEAQEEIVENEETDDGGYEIPDFLRGLDDMDIVKIS